MPYTKEDYLNTEDPYKEVWSQRDNPFMHSQALEKASRAANAAGVKNFKTLYKGYCDAMRKDVALQVDNSTNFDGQMLELTCGDWLCDDFGVRRGSGTFEEVACQIPVLLSHRFENIDSGTEKIELSWRKGGRWHKLIIPCSQYASPKELVKLSDAGLPVNLRMAAVLSDYLMDLYALNFDRIPVSKSVGRLGWVGEKQFSPYVQSLIYDGGLEYRPVFEATTPAGTLQGWLQTVLGLRQQSLAARIVLAAGFASVLVKPLGALPFFVHLWGVDSSTGKTVALMAAASIWANPEMGKYVKTFDGTDVGYERTAAFLNSLPMCIDELQLAKNSRGQVVFNVYRLSQGAGRMRGNAAGGVDVTPTWANAMLTTGETPINTMGAGAGAINRVIEIECTSENKVVQDGHATVQALRKNYAHAGRIFIERLLQDGALDRAKALYDAAFAQLNSSETTDKQAMAAALIIAADTLATEWIFEDGHALTAADIAGFLASKASVSAGARGYAYMCDWVSQNSNRMRLDVESGDVLGLIEGDWAYINSSIFRKTAEEAGYNPQALLSYLKGAGLLKCNKGRSSISKRINGTLTRCTCIHLENTEEMEIPDDAVELL